MTASISSMTGFARVEGVHEARRWTWELKSVNGRGLELRSRLPQGFDSLEPALRKSLQRVIKRGSINASLMMLSESSEPRYRVNETALAAAIAMVEKIGVSVKCDPPRAEGILALRGVMEPVDNADSDNERKALHDALLASFDDAATALSVARDAEGATMADVLTAQFNEIERLTKAAAASAGAAPEALRAKVATQLKDLLSGAALPEERLAQEAALLAVKADVREELDRLDAHIKSGRDLLRAREPVGRQLDFLTQEFNREANTLCSKAHDMTLKRIGLDLKKVIDQLREQVQNIE
ncbi:MAG: YicC/YloC family endoribonuclease [Pseudomonadota bacterium]